MDLNPHSRCCLSQCLDHHLPYLLHHLIIGLCHQPLHHHLRYQNGFVTITFDLQQVAINLANFKLKTAHTSSCHYHQAHLRLRHHLLNCTDPSSVIIVIVATTAAWCFNLINLLCFIIVAAVVKTFACAHHPLHRLHHHPCWRWIHWKYQYRQETDYHLFSYHQSSFCLFSLMIEL